MQILLLVICFSMFLFPQSAAKNKPRETLLLKSLKSAYTPETRRTALQNLYNYYKKRNITPLAQSYLGKLITMQILTNDLAGLETSYIEKAHIYENKKDYPAALDNYFEALNYSKSLKKNNSSQIYLEIAETFNIMNRTQLAAKYLDLAMDNAAKQNNPSVKIQALNAYSSLAFQEGNYTDALRYINLSLEAEDKLKRYVCSTDSLYKKALILAKSGSPAADNSAAELLKAAVHKGLEQKHYDTLLPVMNAYIQHLIDKGELAEAALYLDKIDDLYAPYYPSFFFYYYLRALLFEKMDQMDQALVFYGQTADALQKYITSLILRGHNTFKEQTAEIYSRIIAFYLRMLNRTADAKYLHKAIYFSEIKNVYVYEPAPMNNKKYRRLAQEKKELEKEYLSINKRLTHSLGNKETPNPKLVERYEKKLEILKSQYDELNAFMLEIPFSFKNYTAGDLNLRLIRRKLKPGQLMIKYTLLKENIYAFYLDHRSIGYLKLDISGPRLADMVRQLTEPLDDFTHGTVDYLHINYDLQLAHQLYKILLQEILSRREDTQEIFIVPDRELFNLPFEALVTRFNRNDLDPAVVFSEYASADYLVQKYAVSYYLSLFQVQKQVQRPRWKQYLLCAFGDPSIKKTGITKKNGLDNAAHNLQWFKEIPSSRAEILNLETIFGKKRSRIFLKEQFTRKNFNTYAPRSRVLHIATHFIGNTLYPGYSALLFSSAGTGESGVDYYHAHEIFKLKLDNELVVLSACESAEKHLQGLQALRGMTASFRHAGVRSLMVSMWPVDEHSSRLVPFFYKHYTSGKTAAASLRAARLQLMKETSQLENGLKISFAHPFLWANYILYRL